MKHSPTSSPAWSESLAWIEGAEPDRPVPGRCSDTQSQERFPTDAPAGSQRVTAQGPPADDEAPSGQEWSTGNGSTGPAYHLAAACSLGATVAGVLLVVLGSASRPASLPVNRGSVLLVGWMLVAAGIASAATLWTRATTGRGWVRSALVGGSASILAVSVVVAASIGPSGAARSGTDDTGEVVGGGGAGREEGEPGPSPRDSGGQRLASESGGAQVGHPDSVHGQGLPAAASGGLAEGISPRDAELLVRVRAATAKYENVEVARSEGFSLVVRELPGMGAHFVKIGATPGRSFDPERPNLLLYRNDGSSWKLMAVGYILAKDAFPKPPQTFEGAHWHSHQWLCIFGSGSVGVMPRSECSAKGGFWVEDTGWMLHVWLYEENPAGIFAELNPKV